MFHSIVIVVIDFTVVIVASRGTRETCQSGWTTSLANWKGLAFTVQGPLHGMWKP